MNNIREAKHTYNNQLVAVLCDFVGSLNLFCVGLGCFLGSDLHCGTNSSLHFDNDTQTLDKCVCSNRRKIRLSCPKSRALGPDLLTYRRVCLLISLPPVIIYQRPSAHESIRRYFSLDEFK
ncbi:hypothetical protein TcasGA2_TC007852 [Tribolium castaneum]|uniref:Uncharacterized protein n=1 Tax=Tribolium castaneum TaxID=7070 RepID=D2A2G9_TRICA|nr:hypothetical protein TcasGA2_TC007852 [Tribolium castaneum]